MKRLAVFLLTTVCAATGALAHPGHGKPGFLHSHSAAALADWLANGALALYALAVIGVACWAAWRLLRG